MWIWLEFPWWLLTLNIFSCACSSSVYLLWKSANSDPLPIFKWVLCFLLVAWVTWVLYIFWILIPYQIYYLKILSFSGCVTFSFYWWFIWLCRNFLIWCSPISLFLLSLPLLLISKGFKLLGLSNHWGRLSYLSLLLFGTLHSNGYIFPFLLCP